MNITGGQAIVEFLKRNDITEVFGMAGHGNLAFLDSLIDSHINFYSVPHEQIAVMLLMHILELRIKYLL